MLYLISTFMKIGLLTFGGGSAVTPLLFEEFVEDKKSLTNDEFIDIVTMSNILPGPSMIQMATAIGFKLKGKRGAVIAPIMISIPSVILFTIGMVVLSKIFDFNILYKITLPLLIVISMSMFSIVKKMYPKKSSHIFNLVIIVITLLLLYITNINAGVIIFIGIVFGVIRGKLS